MEKSEKVANKLAQHGINAHIDESSPKMVSWINSGVEHWIFESDITENAESLAWFQSSDNDDHLLVVCKDDIEFRWVPKTYNPAFGCTCIYIDWHKNNVVFVYREKHDIYICTTDGTNITHRNFHGENIYIGDELIAYSGYKDTQSENVNILALPELNHLECVSTNEAQERGINPIFYEDYM